MTLRYTTSDYPQNLVVDRMSMKCLTQENWPFPGLSEANLHVPEPRVAQHVVSTGHYYGYTNGHFSLLTLSIPLVCNPVPLFPR